METREGASASALRVYEHAPIYAKAQTQAQARTRSHMSMWRLRVNTASMHVHAFAEIHRLCIDAMSLVRHAIISSNLYAPSDMPEPDRSTANSDLPADVSES